MQSYIMKASECSVDCACMQGISSDPQTEHSNVIGVQIPKLLEAGYRVVAPDLRGALGGESDIPQEPEAYHIEKHVVKDVAGVPDWAPMHVVWSMLSIATCACFLICQSSQSLFVHMLSRAFAHRRFAHAIFGHCIYHAAISACNQDLSVLHHACHCIKTS